MNPNKLPKPSTNNNNSSNPFHHYQTISPATKLLEKRRKMYQIHQAFENQKQQYKKDQQKFKDIEEDIRKQDQDIQKQLVDFCTSLQQNQAKRRKAAERLEAQKQLYEQKVNEISNLQKQCQELIKHQKKFQKKVVALRKYQQYLQRVQSSYPDQYPEMLEILKRQKTLKGYNQKYKAEQEFAEKQQQNLKVQALTFQKDINQSILQVNNQIKQLSRKIQQKMNERNQLETEVQNTNEIASKKNLDLGKILMAIDNLHFRCMQANLKIKQNFDQHNRGGIQGVKGGNQAKKTMTINANNTMTLTKQKKKQGKQKSNLQQDNNYEIKSKQAGRKLKSIFSFMKDFKNIMDQYKKQKANLANPNKKS